MRSTITKENGVVMESHIDDSTGHYVLTLDIDTNQPYLVVLPTALSMLSIYMEALETIFKERTGDVHD